LSLCNDAKLQRHRGNNNRYHHQITRGVYFKSTNFLGKDRHGRDRMGVGFKLPVQSVLITTNDVISNPAHGEVASMQNYVIKFVSDLREVGGFPRVLLCHPPIKLTATI